ncbi:MAG: hypothetical protein IJB69_00170 [Clostridia bacterium]|nr:hypothetical protein [Clostridia bacterium]
MKKITAFVLVMVMCLMQAQALAALPVDERFAGQAQKSGLKGTVSFAVTGDATALMDSETFQLLKNILPKTEISFGHALYNRAHPGGYVRFAGADGEEKEIRFSYNEEVLAISGNAVSDDDTWYLTEMDLEKVMALFAEKEEGKVPGIQEILSAIEKADAAWKEKALARLSAYETAVSIWMNQYAGTRMGKDGETLYSELSCTIPAQAVKAEIKGLLSMLYDDAETLQLLSEVLSPIGAGIYLNPAMESAFSMLVDQAKLEGDVVVLRRFDARGNLILDSITLPLPPTEKWQQISVEMTGEGDLHFNLTGWEGEKIFFSAQAAEMGYAGNITLEYTREGEKKHIGFDYEFTWQQMEETYSLQTDLLEMLKQGVLTLTPDEETDLPPQRITVDVAYSTTSGARDPISLKVDAVWKDMQTDVSLAVMVQMKTAAPFEVADVAELENVMYFTDMPLEQRQALIGNILRSPFQAGME